MNSQALSLSNDSFQKRKQIVMIAAIVIAAVCLLWLVIPLTHAESSLYTNYNAFYDKVTTELNDGMLESVNALFGSNEATGTVNTMLASARASAEGWKGTSLISRFTRVAQGFALVLCFFYACIAMFKELQRGEGNMDMWARVFVVALIGFVVIANSQRILTGLTDLGEYLIGKLAARNTVANGIDTWLSTSVLQKPASDCPSFSLFSMGEWIWWNISMLLKFAGLAIVFIMFEIPIMSGRVVLLTIFIEILVRRCFFPMALADVCGNGARSGGVVYMKKYFALYIRVGMCVAIAYICSVLIEGMSLADASGFVNGILRLICIFITFTTCTKLYSATSNLAGQVIGA